MNIYHELGNCKGFFEITALLYRNFGPTHNIVTYTDNLEAEANRNQTSILAETYLLIS